MWCTCRSAPPTHSSGCKNPNSDLYPAMRRSCPASSASGRRLPFTVRAVNCPKVSPDSSPKVSHPCQLRSDSFVLHRDFTDDGWEFVVFGAGRCVPGRTPNTAYWSTVCLTCWRRICASLPGSELELTPRNGISHSLPQNNEFPSVILKITMKDKLIRT